MNKKYNQLFNEIKEKFQNSEIKDSDMSWFRASINKNLLKEILMEIVNDEKLLKKIAERSYTHALGFDKIVLMDLKKDSDNIDNKVQLRFHLWENKSLPLLEAMHEHSFNFISLVLTGELENQSFDMEKLNEKESELLIRLQEIISLFSINDLKFLNEQIEIIEALKLKNLGSNMLDDQNLLLNYMPLKTLSLFNLTEADLYTLSSIEGHYVSDRVTGDLESYKHILKEIKSVKPINVKTIKKGEYYFHPYENPHRLYYDNKIVNSTILLTTPIKTNPQGGSLQRLTYQNEKEKEYKKVKLTKDTLKIKLINYLKNIIED